MGYRKLVTLMLKRHEGTRLKPYKDTVGKLTIGIGRNLDDVGISNSEALNLLENDIDNAVRDAKALAPRFAYLSEPRKAALVDMAFNLGRGKLSLFRKFLRALENGDYKMASVEMLDSKWARQVGQRAKTLAHIMEHGAP